MIHNNGLYSIALGKMARKVSRLIKDPSYFDYAIGSAAIQQKMPGLLHAGAAYPAPLNCR